MTPTPTSTPTPVDIEVTSDICGRQDVDFHEVIMVMFSAPVIVDTVEFSLNPDPGFMVSWNAEGTVATLTPSELQPGQTYQLSVLGGQGVNGGRVIPLKCNFTTRLKKCFLPFIVANYDAGISQTASEAGGSPRGLLEKILLAFLEEISSLNAGFRGLK